MDLESLQAELEQLFTLEELVHLSRDLLGLDPDVVGGTSGIGSFAGAVVATCAQHEATEALCDAVVALRGEAASAARELQASGIPDLDDIAKGEELGPYLIIQKLGEGRAGISYTARHSGEEVRLKVLRREATRNQRALSRFTALSRIVSTIEHPVLPVGLTVGVYDGRVCVAHQHYEGQTLALRVGRTGPLQVEEAWPIVTAVAQGLEALHKTRICHGDLRLENVLVCRDPDGTQQVLLLDAGTHFLRARPPSVEGLRDPLAPLTSAATMAPELLRGAPVDTRSDVYAVGALLYEMLAGKPPFEASSALELALLQLTQLPPPLSEVAPRGSVSRELEAFVHGLLARDPSQRPANATVLLAAVMELGPIVLTRRESTITDEEVNVLIEALLAEPMSEEAALALEAAVDAGAEAQRIVEAFTLAGSELEVFPVFVQRDVAVDF